ncbi:hypothetical protein [Paraburkholderia franconis]|uniref:hypothetical protein n=1 Tax=Paraburkholderia franconis TaxID=2654983 RepID=UPI001D0F5C23|nr:hypothetical protein [Paraburkholderia franconis]
MVPVVLLPEPGAEPDVPLPEPDADPEPESELEPAPEPEPEPGLEPDPELPVVLELFVLSPFDEPLPHAVKRRASVNAAVVLPRPLSVQGVCDE